MSVYGAELTALQSSSFSMSSANMQFGVQPQDVVSTMPAASVNGAEAAKFQDFVRGAIPAGQVDHAVQMQLDRLRNAMKVGSVNEHKSLDFEIGEKIVSGFQTLGENLDNNILSIMEGVDKSGPLDIADVIELQFQVAMFSIEMEMTNNVVHKSGQHLDTFLRSQ